MKSNLCFNLFRFVVLTGLLLVASTSRAANHNGVDVLVDTMDPDLYQAAKVFYQGLESLDSEPYGKIRERLLEDAYALVFSRSKHPYRILGTDQYTSSEQHERNAHTLAYQGTVLVHELKEVLQHKSCLPMCIYESGFAAIEPASAKSVLENARSSVLRKAQRMSRTALRQRLKELPEHAQGTFTHVDSDPHGGWVNVRARQSNGLMGCVALLPGDYYESSAPCVAQTSLESEQTSLGKGFGNGRSIQFLPAEVRYSSTVSLDDSRRLLQAQLSTKTRSTTYSPHADANGDIWAMYLYWFRNRHHHGSALPQPYQKEATISEPTSNRPLSPGAVSRRVRIWVDKFKREKLLPRDVRANLAQKSASFWRHFE